VSGGADPGARRLVLSAAEFAVLRRASGLPVPPGFAGDGQPVRGVDAAVASLARRHVVRPGDDTWSAALDGDGDWLAGAAERGADARAGAAWAGLDARSSADLGGALAGARLVVHPSVVANLGVLAFPRVVLRTEVVARGGGLVAVHAVAGELGASLFAREHGAVELSMFPAATLGGELARAVPPVAEPHSVVEALSGRGFARQSLTGTVPLAALQTMGLYEDAAGGAAAPGTEDVLGLAPHETRLAARVAAAMTGALRTVIAGPAPRAGAADPAGVERADRAPEAAAGVLVGQVIWLATPEGWVGLRPEPDGTDRRPVALCAVDPADLGAWAAPYVAEVLAA
jgi:hypothetical protein